MPAANMGFSFMLAIKKILAAERKFGVYDDS